MWCPAQGTEGGDGSCRNQEMRVPDELFQILVIKLGLVIKMRTREEREQEDGSVCPWGESAAGNPIRQRGGKESGRTDPSKQKEREI